MHNFTVDQRCPWQLIRMIKKADGRPRSLEHPSAGPGKFPGLSLVASGYWADSARASFQEPIGGELDRLAGCRICTERSVCRSSSSRNVPQWVSRCDWFTVPRLTVRRNSQSALSQCLKGKWELGPLRWFRDRWRGGARDTGQGPRHRRECDQNASFSSDV